VFGAAVRPFSPIAGLLAAFAAAPAIAWATRSRFYLARPDDLPTTGSSFVCTVCENPFERPDMAFCPVYQGTICSLCCTLEARCHDACKEDARLVDQAVALLRKILPSQLIEGAYAPTARFIGVLVMCALMIGGILTFIYNRELGGPTAQRAIQGSLVLVFTVFMTLSAFAAWFFVLAGENQRAAETETDRQTAMLMDEIEAHGRTDAALQKAKEAAEAANLAKSRYIVSVSHEIRSPLNAIAGYAQLLERNPTENLPDAVRVIRRSATHLADLVNGLLDISRIENGTLRLDRTRVNLTDLLFQIVDMFRLQAESKGLTFDHEWPENLPKYIYIDEKRLRQILINLLSNAIKYTDTGGASLTVRWRNNVAEFIVSDTGVGIAPSDLDRIFEPFERVVRQGRVDVPGIGLGLTITKVLTVVLGGDITVKSELGVGSTFSVKLMLSETTPPIELQPTDHKILGYRGRRRRILVTDDDPVHLELVQKFLNPLGFELSIARDGASCLELARRAPPDLAMMDIAMPGMNGWEAAAALRAMCGDDLAILMVSANAHDFSRGRCEKDTHDDFLIKPYEISDLFERLQALLDLEWTSVGLQDEAAP
jgi:signal transduction histidine kinase/ActR/RegA family two-component response regulator